MKQIKHVFQKYMISISLISGGFLLLLSIIFGFFIVINQQRSLLDQFNLQVVSLLEEKNDQQKQIQELRQKNYVMMAEALEEMIVQSPDIINDSERLASLAKIFSVDELRVVSEEGVVIGSSLKEEVSERSYIEIKCESRCGMIQLGVDSEALQPYSSETAINEILTQLPVTSGHSLVALNRETGDFVFSDGDLSSLNDQLMLLESAAHGKWLKIGDTSYYVVTQVHDDLLLIAMSHGPLIYHQVLGLVGVMTCIALLLVVLVLKVMTELINKSLIKDIDHILRTLNEVKNGSFDIQIAKMSSEELSQISHAINQIIQMITTFNHKLIHIIDVTNLPVVLFEYVESLNQVFITENICSVFELDQKDFHEMRKNSQIFREFLSHLKQNPLEGYEDIYELDNGKYVKVTIFDDEHEMYGVIQDVTCTILERQNMMCELNENRRLARTDYLTGLLNKMAVYERVGTYLGTNQVGVLLLFDLDNFKLVNDTKGHVEGDYVLQLFAKTIQSEFRENDVVGRLGGDEFVVFLPIDMTKQHLEMKLTKLIDRIRCVFKTYYVSCGLSISIGSAKVTSEINTFNQLYVAADQRLYIAKKSGKDKFYID